MPGADTIISLNNVSRHFGPVRAVDDVSFEIKRGEFFSLLGPSGCGKTTLLRMLAGFEVPTAGAIVIDGQDVSAVPPYARPTNMVFQNYAIFPHLNVGQNIAYGLRKMPSPRALAASRGPRAILTSSAMMLSASRRSSSQYAAPTKNGSESKA